jgi:hypothetical protein
MPKAEDTIGIFDKTDNKESTNASSKNGAYIGQEEEEAIGDSSNKADEK